MRVDNGVEGLTIFLRANQHAPEIVYFLPVYFPDKSNVRRGVSRSPLFMGLWQQWRRGAVKLPL